MYGLLIIPIGMILFGTVSKIKKHFNNLPKKEIKEDYKVSFTSNDIYPPSSCSSSSSSSSSNHSVSSSPRSYYK